MDFENIYIKKLLIVLDEIFSYEIRLIVQQAVLLNGFEIINMIDTNKALRFYIESYNTILVLPKTKYISIITKYNKNIQIVIYINKPIKKLFNTFQDIPNLFENLNILKEIQNGFILLDKDNENDKFQKIKKYISDLIKKEMGNQLFQNIEQIYIFEVDKDPNVNEKIFLGVSNSLNFAITQECKAIFKRIDKDEDNEDTFNEITINQYHYYFNKNEIPILLDIESPFKGCFYTTIDLILFQDMNKDNHFLITVYFNQTNFYYISLNIGAFRNSIEFIFYKTIPETIFSSTKYKSVKYEEKFEEIEIFRRLCLVNIDRKNIKSNLIPKELNYGDDDTYKNITVILGENLNVLLFFIKNTFKKRNLKSKLYESIKFIDNINSKTTLEYFELHKNELNNMYFNIKNSLINFDNFLKKRYTYLSKNIPFLIAYGKFEIFRTIFLEETKFGVKYNYNENNLNKFHNIIEQLEKFNEECKNTIKNDELTVAKLFFTASIALKDYLKLNENSGFDKNLIGLIDFKKKGTIYNDAYENNFELILNLNKDSFLYPIFLQLNSGIDNPEIENEDTSTSKYMISKLTLQQIKLDLIKSLDLYGIGIYSNLAYFADTNINTGITIYNEKKIFGEKFNKQKLLTSDDNNYNKRTKISFLQKRERFSHLKKNFYNNEFNRINSPIDYFDFNGNRIRFLPPKNNVGKREFDKVFDHFLTNGKILLIDNMLYNKDDSYDYKGLFMIKIMLEKTNENLMKLLEAIPKSLEYLKINEKKNDINDNTEQNKVEENKISKIDKYIEAKNKMINENPFRKFTFQRNTIVGYTYDYLNHKFIPDN